jgi:hypothetical protein
MKHVGGNLDKILGKVFAQKDKLLGPITLNWHKITDHNLGRKSCPVRISESTENGKTIRFLHVSVKDSSIGLEITYHQNIILERIAIYFGHKIIDRIRVRLE